MWPLLSGSTTASPRSEVHVRGNLLVQGQYKLVVGKAIGAGWAGVQYPNMSSAGHEVALSSLMCEPACLFDVVADPSEYTDLASAQPARVHSMLARLAELNTTIFDRRIPPEDPQCNLTAYSRYGGFLGPWMDL